MKILILQDPTIDKEELDELTHQFTNFYQQHTGIVPEFKYRPFTYQNIPMEPDRDGDMKPTLAWWRKTCKQLYKRYEESVDHLVFMVHEDNWTFRGIWGVNYSNVFSGYQVELCRFDKDDMVNSFGTLYHEVHHSHDAFVYAMLGIDVAPLVKVPDWDQITHGEAHPWDYIRHRENPESIRAIAKPLKQAYQKRRDVYRRKLQGEVLNLATRIGILLRQLISRKYGSKS